MDQKIRRHKRVKPQNKPQMTPGQRFWHGVLVMTVAVSTAILIAGAGYLEYRYAAGQYPLYPLYILALLPLCLTGARSTALGLAALTGIAQVAGQYLASPNIELSPLVPLQAVALSVTSVMFAWLALEMRKGMVLEQSVAQTDLLTGLLNYRRFYARLAEDHHGGVHVAPVSAVAVDCRYLDALNTGSGFSAGDNALKLIGELIRGCLRPHDFAARMPGDEFVVCLPNTGYPDAGEMAKKIRDELSRKVSLAGFTVASALTVCTFRSPPRSPTILIKTLMESRAAAGSQSDYSIHHVHVAEGV